MQFIVILHVGIALWLYRYFSSNDRGPKEPVNGLRIAAAFGVLAVLLAGFVNEFTLPETVKLHLEGLYTADNNSLVYAAIVVGVAEELLKFAPLAVFIYRKGYFNELTDGVVYFALAGIWFGAIESITYAANYGESVGLMRAVTMPFLHAGLTALAGVGLARTKFVTRSWFSTANWLVLAVGLHALYDWLLFVGSEHLAIAALGIAIGINLGLFKFFRVAQKWDERRGMSAVGANNFCRNCGMPNPDKNLFCTRCGKRT